MTTAFLPVHTISYHALTPVSPVLSVSSSSFFPSSLLSPTASGRSYRMSVYYNPLGAAGG